MAPGKRRKPHPPLKDYREASPPPAPRAIDLNVSSSETIPEPTRPQPNDRPFRFLDLPPEIRNLIYAQVIEDGPPARLSRNRSKRQFLITAAILILNKQVYSEFLDLARETPPAIETTVRDFTFSHIITFLNKLPNDELTKLVGDTPERRFIIYLDFTKDNGFDIGEIQKLLNWLKCTERTAERGGAGINLKYECIADSVVDGAEKPLSWQPYTLPRRARAEGKKIEAAIKRYRRKIHLRRREGRSKQLWARFFA